MRRETSEQEHEYGNQPVNEAIAVQLMAILITEGEGLPTPDVYKRLQSQFALRSEDTGYAYRDGSNVWRARVRAAFAGLKGCGAAKTKKRGQWELTAYGREKYRALMARK